ncbi:hypothetical protein A0H81_07408 [Grifola frondosa]|uniref:Glycerol uptake protein 1 n=1 Tax=Grifola frondosa TaxID=5627 RepID=A0A1C7M5G3_GRIFR|nr:hypothetical protein A0H81_07408 [Grifola frondosa]
MPTDLRLESSPQLKQKQSGITNLTVDIPASYNPKGQAEVHSRPRWKTPEFIFYYTVFLVAIPIMIWIPVRLSSSSHPNYPFYRQKLRAGWLFGRQVDNSDILDSIEGIYPRWYVSFNITMLRLVSFGMVIIGHVTKLAFRIQARL